MRRIAFFRRIRQALAAHGRRRRLRRFLEREVWPSLPEGVLGGTTSRGEVESILGMDDPL